MPMSRKGFVELAKAIKDNTREDRTLSLEAVAEDIADLCKRHNPNFDRDRFLAACGL